MFTKYPKSQIVLADDFNIHNATWLRHSNKTSSEGRCVEIFSEQNLLTQLVQEPAHIPKEKICFYKRANWDGLNIFKNYDWSQCFKCADVDFAADSISRVITEGMEEYIPSRVQTIKPKKNAWFDTNCEAVIKTKNLDHRHFLKNATEENRLIYTRSRNLCYAVISKAQFTYEQTIRKKNY